MFFSLYTFHAKKKWLTKSTENVIFAFNRFSADTQGRHRHLLSMACGTREEPKRLPPKLMKVEVPGAWCFRGATKLADQYLFAARRKSQLKCLPH
jgi:hypothetical protein